jgi:hypothetical protein
VTGFRAGRDAHHDATVNGLRPDDGASQALTRNALEEWGCGAGWARSHGWCRGVNRSSRQPQNDFKASLAPRFCAATACYFPSGVRSRPR